MAPSAYKLVLINGQGATGKSTLARLLGGRISHSACICGDAVMSVNPFELDDALYELAFRNIYALIDNFTEAGYRTIIVPGMISNQLLLDRFLTGIDGKADVRFIWLRAQANIRNARRLARSRDDADKSDHFEFLDKLIPDAGTVNVSHYLAIDTSAPSPEEVAEKALKFVEA